MRHSNTTVPRPWMLTTDPWPKQTMPCTDSSRVANMSRVPVMWLLGPESRYQTPDGDGTGITCSSLRFNSCAPVSPLICINEQT
jgi:hypothetical protein